MQFFPRDFKQDNKFINNHSKPTFNLKLSKDNLDFFNTLNESDRIKIFKKVISLRDMCNKLGLKDKQIDYELNQTFSSFISSQNSSENSPPKNRASDVSNFISFIKSRYDEIESRFVLVNFLKTNSEINLSNNCKRILNEKLLLTKKSVEVKERILKSIKDELLGVNEDILPTEFETIVNDSFESFFEKQPHIRFSTNNEVFQIPSEPHIDNESKPDIKLQEDKNPNRNTSKLVEDPDDEI